MKNKKEKLQATFFENLAAKATQATGSTPAIIIAFASVLIWAVLGPL